MEPRYGHLRCLQFRSNNDNPILTRTISITLLDRHGTSQARDHHIDVTAENDPPHITILDDPTTCAENGGAQVLLGTRSFASDPDSPDFDGGVFSASVASGGIDDVLGILNQGTGANQIGVSGSDVTFAGVIIGSYSGGSSGNPLSVVLNSNASILAVQSLLRNITFLVAGDNPVPGLHTIAFVVSDGDGGTSNTATTKVTVANDPPTIDSYSASPSYTENTDPCPFWPAQPR